MEGSPTLVNCTFSGNSADTDGSGGGMYCDGESTVTNCIFWGNTDNDGQNHDESAQIHTDSGTTVVNYSCIEGLDTFTGEGNIGDDPCFVDINDPCGPDGIFGTLDDGLRLTIDSNCIDAADGNAAPSTDILGFGRFDVGSVDNNGVGEPNYADIGAYEFQIYPIIITGGELHTLVLLVDGTLWACGDNSLYQLGIGVGGDQWTLVQVLDGEMVTDTDYLESIVFLDAGWKHSLAVDVNRFVWAWGNNLYGQLGCGNTNNSSTPVQVHDGEMYTQSDLLEGIVKVTAGRSGEYSLACDSDANAWAWGRNNKGQLGNGQTTTRETEPVQVVEGEMTWSDSGFLEDIIDIDAGIDHSIALDESESGFVWTWGENYYGQLGNNQTLDSPEPVWVKGGEMGTEHLEDIVDVAVCCGLSGSSGASYALDKYYGNVWAWGNGQYGKLGRGNTNHSYTPVHVKGGEMGTDYLENITAISAGNHYVMALDEDGNVWAWGDNEYGQLGNGESGSEQYETEPVRVKKFGDGLGFLTDIVYIDAGFNHAMAIDGYGNVWTWGRNNQGQLGLGEDSDTTYSYAQLMPFLP